MSLNKFANGLYRKAFWTKQQRACGAMLDSIKTFGPEFKDKVESFVEQKTGSQMIVTLTFDKSPTGSDVSINIQ